MPPLLRSLASLLGVLCLSYPAQAELKLPQDPDDYRALIAPAEAGPCARCGIVTDVRSAKRQPAAARPHDATPSSGVGDALATTPIAGSGARAARQAAQPSTYYQLSVRFDDGTFAFFEQDEQPAVAKGQRVEVVDGRVQPRTAP